MIKKILTNTLLSAFSLAIALSLCEIVIRVAGIAPEIVYVEKWRVRLSENTRIGYEPIPNLNSEGQSAQFFGYIGRSNNMGYRDYDHPLEKAPGSQRIAVIGDSVTAGLWIRGDENTFTSVMEQTLNQRGLKSDVMNFGVSGYNSSQEIETLRERGLPYKPDLVVVAYCLNDRFQDDGNIYGLLLAEQQKTAQEGQASAGSISFVERHSTLLRFIRYNVIGVSSGSTRQNSQESVDQFYVDTVEGSFAELEQLSKDYGFEVLVAVFPNFGEKDEGLIAENYAFADEHASIAQLTQKHGFNHIDLLAPFQQCKQTLPENYTISFDRYHPNIEGNRCAGEMLANAASNILRAKP
ncbi:SGNH/GDSL hydrolase family protein [Teredinibacter purpureus]|uniref:SGNH/GDSL hydrolase family protein n=1 Tax=Teredinibacter purpureus TaxID=2731756 RepID=UPI0005F7A35F|nr:SGNH/GDSL hydrolase family protein [Teredinibacter purpureus]